MQKKKKSPHCGVLKDVDEQYNAPCHNTWGGIVHSQPLAVFSLSQNSHVDGPHFANDPFERVWSYSSQTASNRLYSCIHNQGAQLPKGIGAFHGMSSKSMKARWMKRIQAIFWPTPLSFRIHSQGKNSRSCAS